MKFAFRSVSYYLCMVVAVTLLGFYPKLAEAARPTLVHAQDVTSGVYISDSVPLADGADHQITLTLNEDGTVEMTTDSQNGKEPLVEEGTWHQSKKGNIVVDLTSAANKKYKKAIEIVFKIDGDQLITVGFDKKLYGKDGFTLTLSDSPQASDNGTASNDVQNSDTLSETTGITGTETVTETAPPSQSEALTETNPATDNSSTPADVLTFVSDPLPTADGNDRTLTLELGQDHSATLMTEFADGKESLVEIGTWEQSGKNDNQLDLTLTGTDSKEYDQPVALVFEIDQATQSLNAIEYDKDLYGEDGFSLTLTDSASDATGTSDSGSSETLTSMVAGVYSSDVLPAADSPGLVMTLYLMENGNAELVSNYLNGMLPIVEIGTWTDNQDETVTLVISGTLDASTNDGTITEYDKPSETTYDLSLDVLIDGNISLYKLSRQDLSDTSSGESSNDQSSSDNNSSSVVYVSGKLDSAPTPDMQLSLELVDDGTIVMTTDYGDGSDPLTEIGTWEQEQKDDSIKVTVTGTADEDYADPLEFVFTEKGNKLVATQYDKETYGSDGLELELQQN